MNGKFIMRNPAAVEATSHAKTTSRK